MVIVSNLGFPRMGANRELKKCVEKFWAHTVSEAELLETTKVNDIFPPTFPPIHCICFTSESIAETA